MTSRCSFVRTIDDGINAFHDLFRVADSNILEHWEVIGRIPDRSEWNNTHGPF